MTLLALCGRFVITGKSIGLSTNIYESCQVLRGSPEHPESIMLACAQACASSVALQKASQLTFPRFDGFDLGEPERFHRRPRLPLFNRIYYSHFSCSLRFSWSAGPSPLRRHLMAEMKNWRRMDSRT